MEIKFTVTQELLDAAVAAINAQRVLYREHTVDENNVDYASERPSHSRGSLEPLQEETVSDNRNLGPTGQFPNGKVNEHDQGELRIAIGAERARRHNRVRCTR
ncbi:MAG: hypothetical protein WDO73_03045 [Ignavibacteriota bacterium]